MAVTIDELHVQVQDAPPPAQPAQSPAEQQKDVDLEQALDMRQERKLRLRAD